MINKAGVCVLLTAALFGCQPASTNAAAGDILCARKHESTPAIIEMSLFWRELPKQLSAGEAVVEVEPVGVQVLALRTPDTEFVTDTLERACTCVSPAALHEFRVTRVVAGDFNAPAFAWLQMTGGCGAKTLDPTTPSRPSETEPAYMVIRPAQQDFRRITPLPVMHARFEDFDPPCLRRPGGPEPAPGC